MNILYVSVKDTYLCLKYNEKTVRAAIIPVLYRYTEVLDFEKETGIVSLMAEFSFKDGSIIVEEDWINLYDVLRFGFENPADIINKIDRIELE